VSDFGFLELGHRQTHGYCALRRTGQCVDTTERYSDIPASEALSAFQTSQPRHVQATGEEDGVSKYLETTRVQGSVE